MPITFHPLTCGLLIFLAATAAPPGLYAQGNLERTDISTSNWVDLGPPISGVDDAYTASNPPVRKGVDLALFADGFEAPYSEPPLTGSLRFSNKDHLTATPGTQLVSGSLNAQNDVSEPYLHVDTSAMGQVSPYSENFLNLQDFALMRYTAGGIAEGLLEPVDLSLANPADSTSGCEAADFDRFTPGRIALVQRGTCSFLQKVNNAEAAGAIAVVIFNQGTQDRVGLFLGTLRAAGDTYTGLIPVVSTSFDLGRSWAASSNATIRIRADVGARSNIWELKPVMRIGLSAIEAYWIRNSVTGEALYPGATTLFDGVARRVEIGDVSTLPRDRGYWTVEEAEGGAKRLRNVEKGEYLATIVSGTNVQLVTASNDTLRSTTSICADDPTCDHWLISEPFGRPPVGTTRIRSALGEGYLHTRQAKPQVDRMKSGWKDGQWILEVIPNTQYRRLLNVNTGKYLHVEYGSLQAGDIEPGWLSAMWDMETVSSVNQRNAPGYEEVINLAGTISVSGYVRFRNRWTDQLLIVDGGLALAETGDERNLAAVWELDDEPVDIPDTQLKAIANDYLGQFLFGDVVLSSEAAGLYTFWAGESGVSSLEGLQHFTNLRDLRVARNSIVDVSPLRDLAHLEYVDLSGNTGLTNIDPLLANEGLGAGDRIIMLEIGELPRDSGEGLTRRGTILLPAPGYMTLHINQVEVSDGTEFSRVEQATNNANWDLQYDPGRDWYYIINRDYGRNQVLYWPEPDQGSRFEFTDFPSAEGDSNAGWQLQSTGQANRYRLFNERTDSHMQTCKGRLSLLEQDINNNQCPGTDFYIPAGLIQGARDRALANYWDPNFSAPPNGFTRIQNVDTREYLHTESTVAPEVGEVGEGWFSAHWSIIPVRAGGYTYYLIQNRWTGRYLRIDGSGNAAVSAVSVPSNPFDFFTRYTEFASYAFVIDGADEIFVIRSALTNWALRYKDGQLSFSDRLIDRSMIWRLDGGLDEPSGFLEVRLTEPGGPILTFLEISWKEPQGGGVVDIKTSDVPNYFPMPADAYDIRVKVSCEGFPDCSLTFDRVVVFDRTYDRPPDVCLDITVTAGFTGGGSVVASCTPAASGPLYDFALQNLQDVACEFNVFTAKLAEIFSTVPVEDVATDLVDGKFARASDRLFRNNDMQLDFSGCSGSDYRTLTFGAGAEGGVFSYDAGGEVGLAWSPYSNDGVRSYTSTGESFGASNRIISAGLTASVGAMKGDPDDLRGRSVGLFLGGSVPLPSSAIPPGMTVGVEGGISLWFTCDTGVGAEFSETQDLPCDLREDSELEGFSFDFGIGAEISLPSNSNEMSGVYSQRCVPANFTQTSGQCSQ